MKASGAHQPFVARIDPHTEESMARFSQSSHCGVAVGK